MKFRLALAVVPLLLTPVASHAQQRMVPCAPTAANPSTGNANPGCQDYGPGNPFTVAPAPYGYTPLAGSQHNVALTSATKLTVPNGATYATVQVKTANGSYETDPGPVTVTATSGMVLSVGATLSLSGSATLSSFQMIAATAGATMDVTYFK